MEQQKTYFPNLHGLRFFAALCVVIHHIEQIKARFSIDNHWSNPTVQIIGKLGVIFFFVLSGFLITYLLLQEKTQTQTIKIKNFYLKRILRIWPLYFWIVFLAMFILPNFAIFDIPGINPEDLYQHFFLKSFLYLFFLPGLVTPLTGMVPYANHTWSIGSEEQFYLIWPWIVKFLKIHSLPTLFLVILFDQCIPWVVSVSISPPNLFQAIFDLFWSQFNMSYMALGGIYAVIAFQKKTIFTVLTHPAVFYGVASLALCLVAWGVHLPYLHHEGYALLFGTIILNFSSNPALQTSLEHRLWVQLGTISYGIYMYHPLAIVAALQLALATHLTTNFLIYPLALALTLGASWVSYHYFEKRILRLYPSSPPQAS